MLVDGLSGDLILGMDAQDNLASEQEFEEELVLDNFGAQAERNRHWKGQLVFHFLQDLDLQATNTYNGLTAAENWTCDYDCKIKIWFRPTPSLTTPSPKLQPPSPPKKNGANKKEWSLRGI